MPEQPKDTLQQLPPCDWRACKSIATHRSVGRSGMRYLCPFHAGFEEGQHHERGAVCQFIRFREPEPVLLTIEALKNGEHYEH